MSTTNLSQLKQALAIAERIHALEGELASVLGGGSTVASVIGSASTSLAKVGKRTMSAATKAKMRASHQARWAMKRGESVVNSVVKTEKKLVATVKRKMSPEGRARIVAALKARWAAKKKGAPVKPAAASKAKTKKASAQLTLKPERRWPLPRRSVGRQSKQGRRQIRLLPRARRRPRNKIKETF